MYTNNIYQLHYVLLNTSGTTTITTSDTRGAAVGTSVVVEPNT